MVKLDILKYILVINDRIIEDEEEMGLKFVISFSVITLQACHIF
jgi:hypothetical protein